MLFYWDLLAINGSSPALARIIKDPHYLVPVCWECLRDQGIGGKVNSWAIIEVKH